MGSPLSSCPVLLFRFFKTALETSEFFFLIFSQAVKSESWSDCLCNLAMASCWSGYLLCQNLSILPWKMRMITVPTVTGMLGG